jgi:hypothetical protein
MKRLSILLLSVFTLLLVASSCSNTKTYAEQLNDEKTLIADYIKRNNINVITTLPKYVSDWKEKDFYLSSSGMYFHMVNAGDTASKDTLAYKDIVVPRYIQYTLNVVSDTISKWSTIEYPYPDKFSYGEMTQSCKGFQEAVSYMKRNDTQAKIIVPSKLGFSTNLTSVTPMGYDLKIKIEK